MSIVLIRHTRPNIPLGTCYGGSDISLPAACEGDFQAVAARLDALGIQPTRVFSSPLQRCLQLATYLYPETPQIQQDDRLREMHFGQWENLPWDQIPREHVDNWAKDVTGFAPPGGDSYAQLYRRCTEFAREQLCITSDQSSEQCCCIVTHGGVIRGLLAFFLQNGGFIKSGFNKIGLNKSGLDENRVVQNLDEESTIAPEIPDGLLSRLLDEPIDFGAVCHIVDAGTDGIGYTIS